MLLQNVKIVWEVTTVVLRGWPLWPVLAGQVSFCFYSLYSLVHRVTFPSLPGLTNATECEDCTGGYYCSTEGLTTVTGTCWAGRLCFFYQRGRSVPCQDLLMLRDVKIVREVTTVVQRGWLMWPVLAGQVGFVSIHYTFWSIRGSSVPCQDLIMSQSLKTYFRCSKEPSHWEGSFQYPQHMFWLRNKENNFWHTLN